MKFKDIEGMTVEELRKKSRELKSEMFMATMKNKLGQLSNPLSIRTTRRSIARVQTAMNQKLSR